LPVVARAEALVAAAGGSWSEAEAQFVKAAETFRRHGMVWQEAKTFQSWGSALRAGADRRSAIEKLDMAIDVYRRQGASGGSIDGGESDAHRTDGSTPALRAPATRRGVFRREGDYWTLSWHGNVVRLKHTKGLYYIAYLLAHPGRQVLARDLAAAKAAGGNERAAVDLGGTAADLGDAGALLDDKAREQYRRRIGELREELAEAVRCNDTFRAASLRSEHEALREQIVGALGLGGRNRKAAWHSERARLMVTKAIKTALAKIRASDASLGRHLATSIKTGNYCAYDPGPLPPGSWQL